MQQRNVHRIEKGGRNIILLGTAHVSRDSADLVERTIAEEKPDTVCVELCRSRYEAIKQTEKWRDTDIIKVIREKRASLLLFQLLMAAFQKKIADRFGIRPGEEMKRAVEKAEETGAEVVLADRDIRTTLLRAWRKMGFWAKFKLLPETLVSIIMSEEIKEEDVERLKQQDALELALQTFGKKMPEVKSTLIDERDRYLARKISLAPGEKIVAVVGAGHVPGILENLDRETDISELEKLPPRSRFGPVLSWGMFAAVIGLFIAGFFYAGEEASLNMIKWWTLITAASAGLGAILVLAHPLTIATAAFSAPIATIHPLIATGWVAGLMEAAIRKPRVKDFLDLAEDIGSVRGFWRNRITRLLILIAIVNLSAAAGTFIAIPFVVRFLHS
ncbi:MAG: TraB/GumN family protein [Syntrophales bacterium]|nr:TraB/GumN family protein [Syntrophales bacterium]